MNKRIRKCPGCKSERPESETLCGNCNWDLTQESLHFLGHIDIAAPQENLAAPERRWCTNDHLLEYADEMCMQCGAGVKVEGSEVIEYPAPPEIIIDGWMVLNRIQNDSDFYEQFIVECNGHRGLLTLYRATIQRDSAIYEAINRLPKGWCSVPL